LFHPKLEYLRISIIDSCNLRCKYCNPYGSSGWNKKEYISATDICEIVKFFSRLGTRKVRITGGEPLLREDIDKIISGIAGIEGIEDLALTTNGVLLHKKIESLREAGLKRVNISLPSVDEQRFKSITGGDMGSVISSIDKSIELGIPVKINVVAFGEEIIRELEKFIGFIKNRDVVLRFIEYMPVCANKYSRKRFIELSRIESILVSDFGFDYEERHNEMISRVYYKEGVKGRIGFIKPVTAQFCDVCNKVRINSRGELRPCLFSSVTINLLDLIRNESDGDAARMLLEFLNRNSSKPDIRAISNGDSEVKIRLFEIGG